MNEWFIFMNEMRIDTLALDLNAHYILMRNLALIFRIFPIAASEMRFTLIRASPDQKTIWPNLKKIGQKMRYRSLIWPTLNKTYKYPNFKLAENLYSHSYTPKKYWKWVMAQFCMCFMSFIQSHSCGTILCPQLWNCFKPARDFVHKRNMVKLWKIDIVSICQTEKT